MKVFPKTQLEHASIHALMGWDDQSCTLVGQDDQLCVLVARDDQLCNHNHLPIKRKRRIDIICI